MCQNHNTHTHTHTQSAWYFPTINSCGTCSITSASHKHRHKYADDKVLKVLKMQMCLVIHCWHTYYLANMSPVNKRAGRSTHTHPLETTSTASKFFSECPCLTHWGCHDAGISNSIPKPRKILDTIFKAKAFLFLFPSNTGPEGRPAAELAVWTKFYVGDSSSVLWTSVSECWFLSVHVPLPQNKRVAVTLTCEKDAAAVLSACLLSRREVSQVPVVARVFPLHLCLHLQSPASWLGALLPLAGVWRACLAVHQEEKDSEPSSWEACPCEAGARHLASVACLGRG